MTQHEKIDYLELPSSNLTKTKAFFEQVFAWTFQDFGPEYTAFDVNAGINGGFYQADLKSSTSNGAALVVLFSEDLEGTMKRIEAAGGTIVKPIFEFPGGRRFHFTEPAGNEFAVWSNS